MAKKDKLIGRVRYVEDWNGHGEHYVFEIKRTSEKEWGLQSAFPIVPYKDGEENTMINYQALTTLREWDRLGIEIHFGKWED